MSTSHPPQEIQVGGTYTVWRKGAPFYGEEVSVIEITGNRCKCVRFNDLFAGLTAPRGDDKRKTETKTIHMGDLK